MRMRRITIEPGYLGSKMGQFLEGKFEGRILAMRGDDSQQLGVFELFLDVLGENG